MRRRAHEDGFTLIELIVVIVIMAMVGGLVLVRQPWHSVGLNTDATVRALMNAMRLARSRAIAQDREVAVVTATGGFSVDGGVPWAVPPNETLTTSQVVFLPDGGSTGGTVLLVAGPRQIVVEVNWLTGRVHARETSSP
jgi:general secretion pathway protein H